MDRKLISTLAYNISYSQDGLQVPSLLLCFLYAPLGGTSLSIAGLKCVGKCAFKVAVERQSPYLWSIAALV
jgi:hypothetical protein